MNLLSILGVLEKVIPILGTVMGHPELALLAQKLIDIAENEIDRRQNETGMTRAQILAEAAATYEQLKTENAALRAAGHENDNVDDIPPQE